MVAVLHSGAETLGRWHGELELELGTLGIEGRALAGRTVITARRHRGPFCIQRPFYPEGPVCHLYLLHPPGGLATGDSLALAARLDPGAHALLTTPAATKVYRAATPGLDRSGLGAAAAAPHDGAPLAAIRQTLDAAERAVLEWLPLETIVFGGSRAEIVTDVRLDPDARFLGWEITALGRPASGDRYESGALEQRTRIAVGDRLLLDERLRLAAGTRLLDAPWGLDGFPVCGALYAYPASRDTLERARATLEPPSAAATVAATLLGPLLVVRGLARDVERARAALESAWAAIRPDIAGRPACVPRVWLT